MKSHTHFLIYIILCFFTLNCIDCSRNDFYGATSDSFVLACGSSGSATDGDGRNWVPDAVYILSSNESVPAPAQYQDSSLPSTVPYMNARFFKSESVYRFTIAPNNRHWVRLHFYPASYDGFNSSDAFFSVTAGDFTLLNNFSASLTAEAFTLAYIIREFYLIPTQSTALNLTFTPTHTGTFAFVNGIEIISTPKLFRSAPLVGISGQTLETESSTMQTMFRLNVGGQYISAVNDSGLTRTWYDDTPYLFGAAVGVTSEADENVTISYPPNLSKQIAPVDVYSTARTMGPDPKVNQNYNLTWVFQIDSNFTYILRFHFCDYQLSKVNQRVFSIFINNQTALETADVITWSHAKSVPVYKDLAVYAKGDNGDSELWVALHPDLTLKPEFLDAILNGLEIFKVNDTNGNLAGPNPEPSKMMLEAEDNQNQSFFKSKPDNLGLIIGAIIGGLLCSALVIGLFFILKRRKSISAGKLPISRKSKSTTTTISGKSSGLCKHFSLGEILTGTNNFDESQVVGVGGFGKVYKGSIDGWIKVAIKRANPSSEQGLHEFQTEIELLSKLRHRHLVSLIGACEEQNEMILVYDYMANGTLREHLYSNRKNNDQPPPVSWKQRLEICIGAARGLHYLHTGAKHTIIHRDVKTTNILLDEKWVAKVSDFGLSKTGLDLNRTHVSTMVKGSFGYLDPEYFKRQKLTEKSDVYSFGVVLFEILCGRPALNSSLPREEVSLADWALLCYRRGEVERIVDRRVKEEISGGCLNQFVETAVKCLSEQGTDRPTMGDVSWNLEHAVQLQAGDSGGGVAERDRNGGYSTVFDVEPEEERSAEEQCPAAIFSQMVNPQGR